jgi:hypothetical protein
MTEEKQQFAERTKATFLAAFDAKYAKGDAEHHNDFFDIDHLREAYDELIDLLTYISAAIEIRQSEYQRGYTDGVHAALKQPDPPDSED